MVFFLHLPNERKNEQTPRPYGWPATANTKTVPFGESYFLSLLFRCVEFRFQLNDINWKTKSTEFRKRFFWLELCILAVGMMMTANDNRKGKNSILEMAQMCVCVCVRCGELSGLWIQEIFTGGRFLNKSWAKQWLQRNTNRKPKFKSLSTKKTSHCLRSRWWIREKVM